MSAILGQVREQLWSGQGHQLSPWAQHPPTGRAEGAGGLEEVGLEQRLLSQLPPSLCTGFRTLSPKEQPGTLSPEKDNLWGASAQPAPVWAGDRQGLLTQARSSGRGGPRGRARTQ